MNNEEYAESFFQMRYLEEEGLFELAWFDRKEEDKEERKYFSVRLLPHRFEEMSAEMVRMVKNYNLMQALKYQEKINESGRIGDLRIESATCAGSNPSKLENGDSEGVGTEKPPEESQEDQPRAAGATEEVIQEV